MVCTPEKKIMYRESKVNAKNYVLQATEFANLKIIDELTHK